MRKISLLIIFILIFTLTVIAQEHKVCDNGHKNAPAAKFCVFCGLKLTDTVAAEKKEVKKVKPQKRTEKPAPAVINCAKCGKSYTEPAPNFCTSCGEQLKPQVTKSTTARQPVEQKAAAVQQKKEFTTEEVEKIIETQQPQQVVKSAEKPKEETEYEKLLRSGESAYRDKYYRIALEYFTQAVKLNPNGEDALFNAGVISFYLKNYSDASEYFEKILSINNKDLDALIYNGLSLYRLGLKEESKNNFKKIILLADKNSEHYQKASDFFRKIK